MIDYEFYKPGREIVTKIDYENQQIIQSCKDALGNVHERAARLEEEQIQKGLRELGWFPEAEIRRAILEELQIEPSISYIECIIEDVISHLKQGTSPESEETPPSSHNQSGTESPDCTSDIYR